MSGEYFDSETGLPESWADPRVSNLSWWSWSCEWLELKWPQWSGRSRRSAVESLVAFCPYMVGSGAPAAPDGLGDWLRSEGYRPGGPDHAWLRKWSAPLDEIDPALLEHALTLCHDET